MTVEQVVGKEGYVAQVMERYEAGTQIGGYRVERAEPLEHLQGLFYQLVHPKTGARHIHVACPDDNNTFCVMFPTVPEDSTGVAHVLEHVTLSGSRRFPIKDPFFSMLPRSLKTFMNAMTSSDWTSYPFSTRNTKDFFNLLQVYLDATFFPLIDEKAFKQEGHRLEFENPDDPSSGLRFKGVVFNEMKGAMAAPGRRMHQAVTQALLPDLTYANNSGGDPEVMPDLTWQNLRDFHALHYHPSNAYFFTYGNLPLDRLLAEIERLALDSFDRIEVDLPIPDQARFDVPKQVEATYPLGSDEDPDNRSQVLLSWLTVKASDSFDVLAFRLLREVLLGNPAAPLYRALIDSRLGDALADGTGFDDSSRETTFSVGLKGTKPEHAEQIEAITFGTLERLAGDGIDSEKVDAAIHQLEIQAKEVTNSGAPFGLKTFFQLAGAWMYGGDPYLALRIDDDLDRLRRERDEGPFLENLIRTWLLDNPHRVRVVLRPDQQMDEAARVKERARLAELERTLGEADKARIVEDAGALKARQETKEDLSILPTLDLTDIPMEMEDVQHTVEHVDGAAVGLFPQPTNGLVYVDVRTDFSGLPDRLKDLLGLFAYAVPRMGAGPYDHVEMARRISAVTGGVSANASLRVDAADRSARQGLALHGKALSRNVPGFMEILTDILTGLRFDAGRLREVIAELRARTESMVVQSGHQFALTLASSKLGPHGALQERLSGLSNLGRLRELAELDENGLAPVIADLDAIRDHLFRGPGLQICVTAQPSDIDSLRDRVAAMLGVVPAEPAVDAGERPAVPARRHEARTTSAMVAYNAKVFASVGYTHPDAPALMALGSFLQSTFIHRELREAGGAYGGFSTFNPETGIFFFASFRDPHIVRTYETFDKAVAYVLEGELDPEEVKEAILSTAGRLDPLLSPDTKGRVRFYDDLAGYTLELKEQLKQRLLEVRADDLRRVAREHLTGDGASLATISNPTKVEEANQAMGGIFDVSPV